MNNFQMPTIPTIFVPNTQSSKTESPKVVKTSKNDQISNSKKDVSTPQKETITDAESTPTPPNPPQLCASCSQILLSYFVPLQKYVNDVVQLASRQQGSAPPPVLTLPNSKSTYQSSDSCVDESKPDDKVTYKQNIQSTYSQQNYGNQNIYDQSERHSSNEASNPISSNQNTDNQYQYSSYDESQSNYSQNQNNNYRASNDNNQNIVNVDERSYNNSNQANTHQNQTLDTYASAADEHSHADNYVREEHQFEGTQAMGGPDSGQEELKQSHHQNQTDSDSHSTYESVNKNESETGNHRPNEWEDPIKPSDSSSNQQNAHISGERPKMTDSDGIPSPFAFVTIAYNNLSATNAIILANSLLLTNNKSMGYTDESGRHIIQVPFVVILGGCIDPALKDAIYMVFDEVISQPMDLRVALLSDESFGIQQYKLQLWKELSSFKKCLYLESSTLVVGKVTNLFDECQELSACVDWLFPDNFNCSVFVFEPNMTTYEQIISFAIFHQKCLAQKDEGLAETLDEMTLLNQFFSTKWKKISFIYNFVRNDAVYTQIPAFMKYGDSIRIVNFGHLMNQSPGLGNQSGLSPTQPWHVMMDLLATTQRDVIKSLPIDNFTRFYLSCFIKRLWPILQNQITPMLVSKYGIGRREWSIFDLIRLLSNDSGIETDDHMFTQTPITLRRIKSPAEKMAEYDNLSIEDEENLSDTKFEDLSDDESVSRETLTEELTEEESIGEKPIEEPVSQQQQDEMSKREWEAGRIDWMGAHQSDKIINRLKKIIRND